MSDRSPYRIPTEFDVDRIEDVEQRERVAGLIVEVNDGKITLDELWKRFSAGIKGDKVINNDFWDVPLVISAIFNIPKAEDINDSIEAILDKIDNLEAKFRNHRHETGKTFSARPEY